MWAGYQWGQAYPCQLCVQSMEDTVGVLTTESAVGPEQTYMRTGKLGNHQKPRQFWDLPFYPLLSKDGGLCVCFVLFLSFTSVSHYLSPRGTGWAGQVLPSLGAALGVAHLTLSLTGSQDFCTHQDEEFPCPLKCIFTYFATKHPLWFGQFSCISLR